MPAVKISSVNKRIATTLCTIKDFFIFSSHHEKKNNLKAWKPGKELIQFGDWDELKNFWILLIHEIVVWFDEKQKREMCYMLHEN